MRLFLLLIAMIAAIGCGSGEKSATEKVNERTLDKMKRDEYEERVVRAAKKGDNAEIKNITKEFENDKDIIRKR